MQTGKILMIEDDPALLNVMSLHVRELGHSLEGAADGVTGLEMALAGSYDLVIIDGNLPKMDGFEVCRNLREQNSRVPILMLTSRNEEIDHVVGLDSGADDYVTKPYRLAELTSRMKALLRRSRLGEEENKLDLAQTITIGGLTIDTEKRRVCCDENLVELTSLEYDLLIFLASHAGRPFTRLQLLEQVWGMNCESYEHSVNLAISRLRNKIEKTPDKPKFVLTVRGVGYRFVESSELELPHLK